MKNRTFFNCLFIFLLLIAGFCSVAQQNTLKDKNGDIMRGVRMIIGKWYYEADPNSAPKSTNKAMDIQDWIDTKALGFNTVRVAWVDPWFADNNTQPDNHWTVEEALPYFDTVVANATAIGMNVIINYHNVAEYQYTNGFGETAEFWAEIAPRYKNNDLVYYELNNEQAWDASTYKSTAFKDPMEVIYNQVRTDAPDRTIIMFSFHSLSLNMLSIAQDYSWIDWNSTVVGYHMYGWGNPPDEAQQLLNEEANFEALVNQTNYRTICTEWSYRGAYPDATYVREHYGQTLSAQPLEAFNQSWLDWRSWDETELTNQTDILIPDAQSKGYWWESLVVEQEAYPSGVSHVIPGVIEVEDYDLGGEDVAYADGDTANQGGEYRLDAVDVYQTGDVGGGYAVGWIGEGEWLEYSVNVEEDGIYDLTLRLGTAVDGGQIRVLSDGTDLTGVVAVVNTGDWDTFNDVIVSGVSLDEGEQVLKLEVVTGGFNINYFKLETATTTHLSENVNEHTAIYPNPTNDIVQFDKKHQWQLFSLDGQMISQGLSDQIDLSKHQGGVYMVLIDRDERQLITKL